MARNAAMEGDGHLCPTHGIGQVLHPSAQHTIVGDSVPTPRTSLAVRIGDGASCPQRRAPEHVTQGTTETVIEGRGAARVMDTMEHGGQIYGGAAYVVIGQVLLARVVIVQGTCWDSPAGRAEIARQIETTESVLGIRVVTGPYETQSMPGAVNVQRGPWNATNHYSPQIVGLMNGLGAAGRPAMLFTGTVQPAPIAGLTVANSFALPADGLTNEGVVFGCNAAAPGSRAMAHECGHLLGGLGGNLMHDTVNRMSIMWPHLPLQGTNWTDPWMSAAEGNGLLR